MAKMSKARTARHVLPQTPEDFEQMTTILMEEYELQDRKHTQAVMVVAIQRLPADTGYVTLQFLANNVRKSRANHVAKYYGQRLNHESQIDLLVEQLVSDPLDQEARDKLEQCLNSGSEYARDAMIRLGMEVPEVVS